MTQEREPPQPEIIYRQTVLVAMYSWQCPDSGVARGGGGGGGEGAAGGDICPRAQGFRGRQNRQFAQIFISNHRH